MKCDSCGTTEGVIENDGASGISMCADGVTCGLRKSFKLRVDTGRLIPEDFKHDPLLQFFKWDHLPEPLRQTSARFAGLALGLVSTTPRNPERTVALRKLLEAKDCAVRAKLWVDP